MKAKNLIATSWKMFADWTISSLIPVKSTTTGGIAFGGFTRDEYLPSSKGMPSGSRISAAISIMWQRNQEKPVVSNQKQHKSLCSGYVLGYRRKSSVVSKMIGDHCDGLQSGFLTTMVNSLSLCLLLSCGDRFEHCGLAGHNSYNIWFVVEDRVLRWIDTALNPFVREEIVLLLRVVILTLTRIDTMRVPRWTGIKIDVDCN